MQLDYGEDAWCEVVQLSRCKWFAFNTFEIYPDWVMPELAAAAAKILTDPGTRMSEDDEEYDDYDGEPTADRFMRYFGRCFVRFFSTLQHFDYDEYIRATGRYFCEFLKNVDNLHLQIRFKFPKMKSPSMYMSHADRDGCVLVYRSTRRGLTQYIMGKWCGVDCTSGAANFPHVPTVDRVFPLFYFFLPINIYKYMYICIYMEIFWAKKFIVYKLTIVFFFFKVTSKDPEECVVNHRRKKI